jgi:hypothetical protein
MDSSQVLGVAAAMGFLAIMTFQVLLALGSPLGRAAWGGAHVRLPTRLRAASAAAALVYVLAAVIVLGRAGYLGSGAFDGVFYWGTWVLVGAMGLGALLNAASSSKWERFLMAPIAFVLALLCLGVSLRAA